MDGFGVRHALIRINSPVCIEQRGVFVEFGVPQAKTLAPHAPVGLDVRDDITHRPQHLGC